MNSDKNQSTVVNAKIAETKKLTQDIIELGTDIGKNGTEIKEKMRSAISLVGFVMSYPETNPEPNKNPLTDLALNVFELIDKHPSQKDTIMTYLKLFGNFANNLTDAVTKRKGS